MNPDLEDFSKHLYKEARKQAIASPFFKDLTRRRYHDPKGYIAHKEIMLDLAINLMMAETVPFDWSNARDSNRTLFTISLEFWRQKAGSYWLNTDLFQAFQASELPEHITSLQQAIPTGLLLLPPGLTSPDGEPLRWLLFLHRLKGEAIASVKMGKFVIHDDKRDFDYVAWTTMLPSTTTYSHVLRVDHPELSDKLNIHPLISASTDSEAEKHFVQQVTSVLVQSLLAVQIHPELLDINDRLPKPAQPRINPKKGESKWLNPNWIGHNFQIQRPATTIPSGSHSSPALHWRKGHWRRVAIGKREENRRQWRWFQPVLVGAKNSSVGV